MFHINEIDNNTVQIYGGMNGFACKRHGGEMGGSYAFSVRFIIGHRLVKVSNSEKDGSVRNIEKLKERLTRIYEEELSAHAQSVQNGPPRAQE